MLFQISETNSISNFTNILFQNCEIYVFFSIFLVETVNFYGFYCLNCFGNFFHIKYSGFVNITNNHFDSSIFKINLINYLNESQVVENNYLILFNIFYIIGLLWKYFCFEYEKLQNLCPFFAIFIWKFCTNCFKKHPNHSKFNKFLLFLIF